MSRQEVKIEPEKKEAGTGSDVCRAPESEQLLLFASAGGRNSRLAGCSNVNVCPPDGKDLYVGKAVQKAYLEVTEEGSEAAVGSGRRSECGSWPTLAFH